MTKRAKPTNNQVEAPFNLCPKCKRAILRDEPCPHCRAHQRFTHNDDDTIYHQATQNSMRCAFLIVSEFFDTPSPGVTDTLKFICDALNAKEST